MVAGFMPITEVFTDLRPGGGFDPCVSFLGLLSQMTTYWVVYNNVSLSQCRRPEVQSQVSAGLHSSKALGEGMSCLFLLQGAPTIPGVPMISASVPTWRSPCVSSKNISHWIQGPP